jgi:hypothetical protein
MSFFRIPSPPSSGAERVKKGRTLSQTRYLNSIQKRAKNGRYKTMSDSDASRTPTL